MVHLWCAWFADDLGVCCWKGRGIERSLSFLFVLEFGEVVWMGLLREQLVWKRLVVRRDGWMDGWIVEKQWY